MADKKQLMREVLHNLTPQEAKELLQKSTDFGLTGIIMGYTHPITQEFKEMDISDIPFQSIINWLLEEKFKSTDECKKFFLGLLQKYHVALRLVADRYYKISDKVVDEELEVGVEVKKSHKEEDVLVKDEVELKEVSTKKKSK